jgi:AcrR family transcriptional regulator
MVTFMNDGARLPAGSSGRQERAERILDVTAGLLLRHGYKRVTIDDVATGAGIGKGTIYLHWKTREALFWAVLQRDAARLLEQILARLAEDPGLALPSRLMRAIFVEVARRPLVRALLLSDAEVLGALATDTAVAAAQRELGGNQNYLELLRQQHLLRPDLTVAAAGVILSGVMRGFFAGQDAGQDAGAPLTEQADLLADVLHRSLEIEGEPPPDAVAALAARVSELFTAIVTVQRSQLQRAYG